ncbi:MAG: hypothetical protein V1813_01360 [Candidatus Aenigmatarchaeota archaeon]
MPLEGYTDYKRREFCNDVKCPVQALLGKQEEGSAAYEETRALCKSDCIRTTYEFHHWLTDKGFLIVKPKK